MFKFDFTSRLAYLLSLIFHAEDSISIQIQVQLLKMNWTQELFT